MADASNKLVISWRDVAGKLCTTAILIAAATIDPSGAAVSTLVTAMSALSKAASYARTLSFYGSVSDTAAQADYGDNEDKAELIFSDEDGGIHKFLIPAPLATLFTSDLKTVDATDTLVSDFVGFVTGTMTTRAGRAITTFRSGKRVRRDRKAS